MTTVTKSKFFARLGTKQEIGDVTRVCISNGHKVEADEETFTAKDGDVLVVSALSKSGNREGPWIVRYNKEYWAEDE